MTGKFTSRWPRFPHVALRPHPSRHGSESASSQPAPCQKDVRRGVRRGDRGQRPTATKDPNPEQRRRRPSRHCSWARRPRFPHLALRPHPSRHGSESASSQPVPCQKDVRRGVRRRDWGQRPTAKIRGAAPLPLGRGYETTTQGSLLPDEGKVNETSNGRHPLFLAWSSPMVPRMP